MKSHGRMFPRIVYMAIASFLLSTLVACQQPESGKKSEANQSSESNESNEPNTESTPSDVAFELGVPGTVQKELNDAEVNEEDIDKIKNDIVAKLGKIGGDSVNVVCKDKGERKRTFGFLYLSLDEVGTDIDHGMDDGVEPPLLDASDTVNDDAPVPVKPKKHLKPKHKKFKFGGHNGRKFIPLFCTNNLSIELKGLTKGATYQLTAQFYSLSKKVKYDGVAVFSYPEESKIDLFMTPVKQGTVNVNVIFDDEDGVSGSDQGDKDDPVSNGTGTLVVNFNGKTGKDVGLVAMSTDGKCGISSYKIEDQCSGKQLWKSAAFTCQDKEDFTEKSVLCREPAYFEKLSETKCLDRCSSETSYKEVVTTKKSTTLELEQGSYWIIIRSNIEKDDSIDKKKVYIKEGAKASVDLTL